jgi:methylmalonyl-CoA mutase N-terminal domain/subunit
MAFDLPTQLGLDSDDPRCLGEVGRTGVAIDTLDDMRLAFDGIPLDQVSTSMTINAPAAVLLALRARGRRAGRAERQAARHDPERRPQGVHRRGNYIYPPGPTMRLTTDLFAYCKERIPRWNTSPSRATTSARRAARPSRRSPSPSRAGSPTCRRRSTPGLAVDDFAPRLAFFFNGHNHVFQEVRKFRAARRMWATIMRDRFGAQDPRSMMLRFHTQTAA